MKKKIIEHLLNQIQREHPNYSIQAHRQILISFNANENVGALLLFIDNAINEAYLKFGLNMFSLQINYSIQYNDEACSIELTLTDPEELTD